MVKNSLQQEIGLIASSLASRIVEAVKSASLEELMSLQGAPAPRPGRKPMDRRRTRRQVSEQLPSSPVRPSVYSDQISEQDPYLQQLSAREFQVFNAIIREKTTTQISKDLNLSPKTVSTYKTRIFSKLQMENDAQLILYAARKGIIQ